MKFSNLIKVFKNINNSRTSSTVSASTNSTHECGTLQKSNEDLSTLSSYYPKTFNLALYVNSSEILQSFMHLNVNLNKIEKKPHVVEKILKLEIDQFKNQIFFLKDYVNHEDIGNFITKNPLILCEPIENLQVRLNYLQSKHFKKLQIERIVTKNPYWLMFSTERIDRRLGYYQEKFNLHGEEVRTLSVTQPKLITYNLHHVTTNTFVIKEEMGFDDKEIKELILKIPKLWMINQKSLIERFNYIHNVIKLPHSSINLYPKVLLCRNFKVKQRYLFLKKLGRDQFDPRRENYVPVMALAEGTDVDFCKLYAKCNISDFNTFLKTL